MPNFKIPSLDFLCPEVHYFKNMATFSLVTV
jgi:hypothetical protein